MASYSTDESDDILGGALNLDPSSSASSFSLTQISLSVAGLLVLYVTAANLWDRLSQWREKRYKLRMRRRHGIPDTDHRPFNVAWAAAVRNQNENNSNSNNSALRNRFSNTAPLQQVSQPTPVPITGLTANTRMPGGSSLFTPNPTLSHPVAQVHFASHDSYAPSNQSFTDTASSSIPSFTAPFSSSSKTIATATNTPIETHQRRPKRSLQDPETAADIKKTRVEGDELIDGSEDPSWAPTDYPSIRGREKRKGSTMFEGEREKRPRRATAVVVEEQDDDMDVDSVQKGQKRVDRSDDEEQDDFSFEDSTKRQKNKRRVDKVILESRGKKRERESMGRAGREDISDDERESVQSSSPEGKKSKKAGKKNKGKQVKRARPQDTVEEQEDEGHGGSDISVDPVSDDQGANALTHNRRVGEEWESGGVRFKVVRDKNGKGKVRLRQALVKKARSRFIMPKDSLHPDREENIQVYVETWMTEEEYALARERQLLAWQDPVPVKQAQAISAAETPETPGDVKDTPPPRAGKPLLWAESPSKKPSSATNSRRGSTVPPSIASQDSSKDLYRQNGASQLGLGLRPRLNPFQQAQPSALPTPTLSVAMARSTSGGSGRVIAPSPVEALGVSVGISTPSGTPNRKGFSKWEKQDLEAEAMRKMRARTQTPASTPAVTPSSSFALPAPKASTDAPASATPAVSAPPLFALPKAGTDTAKPAVPLFNSTAPMTNPAPKVDSAKPAAGMFSSGSTGGLASAPPLTSSASSAPGLSGPAKPTTTPAAASTSTSVPTFFNTTKPTPAPSTAGGMFSFANSTKSAEPVKPAATPVQPTSTPAFSFPTAVKTTSTTSAAPTSNAAPPAANKQPNFFSNTTTTTSEKPKEQPKPAAAFSFGNPTPPTSGDASASFGAPKEQEKPKESSGASASLLARLSPASTPAADKPASSFSFGGASSSSAFGGASGTTKPAFGFGGASSSASTAPKPAASAFGGTTASGTFGGTAASSAFGGTTTPSAFGTTPAATPAASKPAATFDFFSQTKKPDATTPKTTPPAATATTPSSLSGALGNERPIKPVPSTSNSLFGGGASSAAPSSSSNIFGGSTPAATSAPPQFDFGLANKTQAKPTEPVKSTFGANTTNSTGSAFGASSSSSPFGTSTFGGSGAFGSSAPSAFGGAAPPVTPAKTPAPSSGESAKPTAAPAFSFAAATDDKKPASAFGTAPSTGGFSFGGSASSSTPAATATSTLKPAAFSFSGSASTAPAPSSGSSVFGGATTTPSAFSAPGSVFGGSTFGGSSSSGSSGNIFGAGGSADKPSTGPAAFGFGSGSSVFGAKTTEEKK